MADKLTVTLTGRPPVRINKADWPIIATAEREWHDGEYRCQANRSTEVWMKVRQHADGRTIVYGRYVYDTWWQGEEGVIRRCGELLATGDSVVDAICRVAGDLYGADDDAESLARLTQECIAALPAVEL